MILSNFIVLESNPHAGYSEEEEISYTLSGQYLFPIDTSLPVIVRGKGCIGLGIIRSITLTADMTTIDFEIAKATKEEKKVFYSLYQSVSAGGTISSDPYENTDVLIPGAMGSRKSTDTRNYDRPTYRSNTSLSSYLDD